jgi:DNA-binding MurR/RpiR family transcriptional regulator
VEKRTARPGRSEAPAEAAEPPAPRPEDDGLDDRIRAAFPGLTRKQQRLAQLLLEEKVVVAFSSADELGRQAGVDAATVVRFSQRLGYEGFSDLRQAVRQSIPRFLTALERINRTLARHDEARDVVERVYADDITNVEETARLNDAEILDDAVAAILAANQVYVLGFGVVAPIADLLVHQLTLVGTRSHRARASVVDAAIDIASARTGDVVVSLDVWRYLKGPVELTKAAWEAGAMTIAISDSTVCPLARAAEISLVASTATPELSHSVTAFVTLVNIVATKIALATPTRTVDQLARVDDLYGRVGELIG